MVEEEPNSARPGGELRDGRLFDLGRRASRKIVVWHIGIPVRQGCNRETANADLRQRRNADRRPGGNLRRGKGGRATDQASREEAPPHEAERQGAGKGAT
ncbi:hypothetical protein D3C71_1932460 [compost metagenome]